SEAAEEQLRSQFATPSLMAFGIQGMHDAIVAAGAIMHYLDYTKHTRTAHITSISRIEEDRYVRLDKFTVRNLELVQPLDEGGRSLLGVLDRTVTPMGSRLLHRWLMFPLRDPRAINERLDVVEAFFRMPDERDVLEEQLHQVGDLERLVSKVATRRATPRDLLQIRAALVALEPIRAVCAEAREGALRRLGERLDPCGAVADAIGRTIRPDAGLKGEFIAEGVSAELDELRAIAYSGKDYLLQIQAREVRNTGITSLKIGFNNVFGYYIEVTNTHRDKVPTEWIRKQTLVNAERYITQELKEYEEKILTAQDKIASLQESIYNDLITTISAHIPTLQQNAATLAKIDVLSAFTRVAIENRYTRPVVDDSLLLRLTEARHPVIERQLPPGEPYISNTVELDNDTAQILMITGPNMSGKSALLRQTALNVIMAQCGCYVAAESAHIGVVDKIFTRVGASDNISLGESTFMVEMNEASAILNNMSRRSLVLFDELGRGTSTYDGISIAWSIIEYIHEHQGLHPKTLFATHYHELNDMAESFERIRNVNVSVKEIDGKVVFLRKLAPGGSEHSFGIHVARLAGMPREIVERADSVLHRLEKAAENGRSAASTPDVAAAASAQPGV
ncbi:MAG: DNA mismatch repair protein MutS, partial [Muribaculaceae bacterium]|nr:DNA mismatch repair protein MutS [Muribaculaceae bacterium]